MILLSRILENRYWLIGVLGTIGITLAAVLAWRGGKTGIVMLTFFALAWLGFTCLNGRGWRRALYYWNSTIDQYKETAELVNDQISLLHETLKELRQYDGEKADELSSRMATITLLRLQNMEERSDR